MRPFSIPLLASLALLGLTQAKSSVKTVCTTGYGAQKGTRTHSVADQITVVQKPASASCRVTKTAVVTPKAKTVTSIKPVLSTTTVTDSVKTGVATETSYDFAFVFPTTTSLTTVTPVVTATITVPNPGDETVFITSYTLSATTSFAAGSRRGLAEAVEPRASPNVLKGLQNRLSAARRGKDIYCHKEITTTTTVKKPCKTVTRSSTASRSTTTMVSTFVVSVTNTAVFAQATSTRTINIASTVTAPMITVVETSLAAAKTATLTITAPLAVTTTVVSSYTVCEPNLFMTNSFFSINGINAVQAMSASDEGSCCSAAAAINNAVAFQYDPAAGMCVVNIATDPSSCPAVAEFGAGTGYIGGWLQCGAV